MSHFISRESGARRGHIRSAMLAQKQYLKMYFTTKLLRLRIPAPLVLLANLLLGFLMLAMLMFSVVAIDVISTALRLCRNLLGLGHNDQGRASCHDVKR